MSSRFRTKVNDTTIGYPPNSDCAARYSLALAEHWDEGTNMTDRVYNPIEVQDRFAIADLYDRQLAAAEAWDLASYDTTFAATAEIDLRDFGQPVRPYGEYR